MKWLGLLIFLIFIACQPVIVQQPTTPAQPAVAAPAPAPVWTPAEGHIYFLAADGTVLRDYLPADYGDSYAVLWYDLANYVFPTFKANNSGATMIGGGP